MLAVAPLSSLFPHNTPPMPWFQGAEEPHLQCHYITHPSPAQTQPGNILQVFTVIAHALQQTLGETADRRAVLLL